jgi:hypothetical protein
MGNSSVSSKQQCQIYLSFILGNKLPHPVPVILYIIYLVGLPDNKYSMADYLLLFITFNRALLMS